MKKTQQFLTLALALILAPNVYANDLTEKSFGFEVFHGTNEFSLGGGPSTKEDYSWTSGAVFVERGITDWLSFRLIPGIGYLNSDSESSLSIEASVAAHMYYKFLYLDIQAGSAYLFDNDHLPDLAESWLYGTFGAALGIIFYEKEKASFALGYRFRHISSPFHSREDNDKGWNVGGLEVQFRIIF